MNNKEEICNCGKAAQILHPVLETMTRALNCTGWVMMKTPLVTEYIRLETIDGIEEDPNHKGEARLVFTYGESLTIMLDGNMTHKSQAKLGAIESAHYEQHKDEMQFTAIDNPSFVHSFVHNAIRRCDNLALITEKEKQIAELQKQLSKLRKEEEANKVEAVKNAIKPIHDEFLKAFAGTKWIKVTNGEFTEYLKLTEVEENISEDTKCPYGYNAEFSYHIEKQVHFYHINGGSITLENKMYNQVKSIQTYYPYMLESTTYTAVEDICEIKEIIEQFKNSIIR